MGDRPIGRPSDAGQSNLYDAIQGRSRTVGPETAPLLRSMTVASIAELRRSPGSSSGNRGPRAVILAGTAEALDGGQAIYVWDPTSTADDNSASVLQVAGTNPGRWRRAQTLGVQAAAVLAVRYLTAGVTAASTSGARRAWARCWGGGGGGGGVAAAGGGQVNIGGGGGAGSYAEFWTTTIPANWTYALGAAGVGGSSVGGQGGDGGSTTFSDGVTTVTAPGGGGAPGDASGAAFAHLNNGGNGGAVSTNGTANGTGAPGGNAVHVAANQAYSGAGASTLLGAGAPSSFAASVVGAAGALPGGGGAGGIDKGTGVGRTGGAGGAGAIILVEFG